MATQKAKKSPLLGTKQLDKKILALVICMVVLVCGVVYFLATHASSNPYACSSKPTLRQGSSGDCVKYLQYYLYANSDKKHSIDGSFGTTTYDYVLSFQECAGLTTDGIVGSNTWNALESRWRSYGRICYGSGDVNRAAAPIRASIDVANCQQIGGWVYDTKNSSKSLDFVLYIGNNSDLNNGAIASYHVASGQRDDVNKYFGISGAHGFAVATPSQFKDGRPHQVGIMPRWRIWAWLPSPTKTLQC